jgi:outer membrane receptor protein involved in Fe transport
MFFRFFLGFIFLPSVLVAQDQRSAENVQDLISLIDTVHVAFRAGEGAHSSSYTCYALKKPVTGTFHRTLPESLAEIPGIQVQKTNHGGGSPYFRGLTGNQILTLVDGIRLNNSTYRYGPNQYLNTLDGFAISQVDLALGTGSVQYGSDAIGGALIVYYRRPEFTGSVSNSHPEKFKVTKVGSITRLMSPTLEGSQRLYLDAANNKVAFTAGITFRHLGDVVGGGNTGRQIPTGYDEVNGDLRLRLKANKGEWEFAYQSNQQFNVPVYHKVALENFETNQMDIQARNLAYARRFLELGNRTNLKFTTGIIHTLEERSAKKNLSMTTSFEKDEVNTRFFLTEFNHRFRKFWLINSGYEAYYDKVGSSRILTNVSSGAQEFKRGLYPDNSRMLQQGVYLMAKGDFKWVDMTLGSRFQSTQTEISEKELGLIRDRNWALVHTIGISSAISRNPLNMLSKLRLFANYSGSFRAPNIDDLGTLGIVDFRYEIPQFDLKPEYSNNHEVGFKWSSDFIKFNFSVYQNYLYNVIARVKVATDSIQGYQVYKKENVERAIIQGAECYTEISISSNFRIKAGYIYTIGDNLTRVEPMRRISPENGLIQLNYLYGKQRQNRVFMRYMASNFQRRLAAGDISDNRIGTNGTAGFIQLDFGLEFFLNNVRIATGMQNISNEIVKVHGSGILMPGRSVNLIIQF